MDWAAMIMQMYKLWAQRRGYKVTVMEEMPGEIAGIKVLLLTILHVSLRYFLIFFPNSSYMLNLHFSFEQIIVWIIFPFGWGI
jgi:hypothetical protein